MIENLLLKGLQQALILSLAVILLRAVRPVLLRQGADIVYAGWLLVPALLLTPTLPRPSSEPLQIVWAAADGTAATGLTAMPSMPHVNNMLPWLLVWLTGTLVVLALCAWRHWRLIRLTEPLPAGSSPALVGLLRPRVALPADFELRFSPEERELILAHEAVHRMRLDNLWNLFATLLTALHWWNPLAWWAVHRMRADQELACDAAVLRKQPNSKAAYIRALLATHSFQSRDTPLASHWSSTHPLVERITMLKHHEVSPRRRFALLGLGLLSTVGLAWAAQTAPANNSNAQRAYIQTEIRIGAHVSNPALLVELGVPATIGIDPGDGGGHWEVLMTVTQQSDGQLRVRTERSFGTPVQKLDGNHTQIGLPGMSMVLTFPAPDGGPDFVMKRVVKLVPVDFVPTQR
ncbi:M56 family metallopeptidase [Paucibacter sp. AS339]|uniref:M56 family metallopeptidase n=1 Tax=Paucibacter hankyongi TaxID=3133434 RepID=UPI0030B524D3